MIELSKNSNVSIGKSKSKVKKLSVYIYCTVLPFNILFVYVLDIISYLYLERKRWKYVVHFRGWERNVKIERSPKICENLSKICIKINKYLRNYRENSRKMQTYPKTFSIFERDYENKL